MNKKILLNIGAGHPDSGAHLPRAFRTPEWNEVRLDIDPMNQPDIMGTMLDMSAIASGSVDVVYSSHTIEHLYPSELPDAIREMLRVLKPDGYAVITCPDLQSAAQMIAEDKLLETAYVTAAGVKVTPFDIFYSHQLLTGRDKPFMAHHSGFTLRILNSTLMSNGFGIAGGWRRLRDFDLWVVASKAPMEEKEMEALAWRVLPKISE